MLKFCVMWFVFWWHSKVLLYHAFIITLWLFKFYAFKGVLVISQLLLLRERVNSWRRAPAESCVKARHNTGRKLDVTGRPSVQQQQLFPEWFSTQKVDIQNWNVCINFCGITQNFIWRKGSLIVNQSLVRNSERALIDSLLWILKYNSILTNQVIRH